MDAVVRGVIIYVFLMLLFRIAGKRSVAQITTFDFVLLLIIGEATQQALLSDDFSMTNALVLIATLIGFDILVSLLTDRFPRFGRIVNGSPLVILEDGKPLRERMHKARVDESDILTAAREAHGLERLDQIKYAVLERSGGVSIVPKPEAK